jgi:hypothetical protein
LQRQNATLRENMLIDPSDFLLNQGEYAKIRHCSERTIERERAAGTGCKFIKIGRAVRYRRRDILEFIERHVRQSTSENPTGEASGLDVLEIDAPFPGRGSGTRDIRRRQVTQNQHRVDQGVDHPEDRGEPAATRKLSRVGPEQVSAR